MVLIDFWSAGLPHCSLMSAYQYFEAEGCSEMLAATQWTLQYCNPNEQNFNTLFPEP